MNIKFRIANHDDIEPLERFYHDVIVYQDEHEMHQWDDEEVTWKTLSKTYRIEDFHIGLYQEDIVCACAIVDVDTLYWPEMKQGDSLYLHKIAVHPRYRKSGAGSKMLEHFMEQGRISGKVDVRLDVRCYKTKLRAFYEQHGFEFYEYRAIFPDYDTALYRYKLKEGEKFNETSQD